MTVRRLTALATALAGLLTLLSSVTPNLGAREHVLAPVVPGPAQSLAHVAGVLAGVALVVLSRGLLRGRRRASGSVIVVLSALVAVHVAKGLDYEEALISLVLAGLLGLGHRAATRGARPPRMLAVGLAVIAVVTAGYVVLVAALLVAGPGSVSLGAADREGLEILGGVAVVLALLWGRSLVAPSRSWDGHEDSDHARAAALVAAYGTDPLAPFALRADKAFFFARGGLLAYRTLGGTAVVSGDPIGPDGEAPAIIADFLAYAGERGWDVALAAAGPDHLEGYRALGLRTLQVGAEAVVDPQAFTLTGRSVRKVRQSVTRAERRGWTVAVVEARELDAGLFSEISDAEEEWRGAQPRRPGFAMSMDRLWGAPEDRGDVYVLGRDPEGRLRSFLRFVAYREGLSLDAMRRLGDEPNGLTEALVVAALAHAREAGLREVSLNFAGFAHVMGDPSALGWRQRLLRIALLRMRGHFQLDRLIRFNEKFSPGWRSRHLVYSDSLRLPVAGLRVLQAESYVPAPRPRRPAGGWVPRPVPVFPVEVQA